MCVSLNESYMHNYIYTHMIYIHIYICPVHVTIYLSQIQGRNGHVSKSEDCQHFAIGGFALLVEAVSHSSGMQDGWLVWILQALHGECFLLNICICIASFDLTMGQLPLVSVWVKSWQSWPLS